MQFNLFSLFKYIFYSLLFLAAVCLYTYPFISISNTSGQSNSTQAPCALYLDTRMLHTSHPHKAPTPLPFSS